MDEVRTPPTLRPDQVALLNQCRALIGKGTRRFIVVAMMGFGKTVLIAEIIRSAAAKGSPCIIICGRRELVRQTSEKLTDCGTEHGIIMADGGRARSSVDVQVASVDTLLSRLKKMHHMKEYLQRFKIVAIDECHHAPSEKYLAVLEHCRKDAVLIGLTATPQRLDGKPLNGELFHDLVVGPPASKLIRDGSLVPVNGFSYLAPDISRVKKKRGDYDEKELEKATKEVVLGGVVIEDYLRDAAGKRAILFAINKEVSEALVAQARAAGISAEHVDDSTPADQRDALLHPTKGRFARGDTMLVGNCTLAAEGTDVPAIECVILTRATLSLTLALQMIGRGMRPFCFDCVRAPRPDCKALGHRLKTHCRVHDHAGLLSGPIGRLVCRGLGIIPDDPIAWDLNRGVEDIPTSGDFVRAPLICSTCKSIVDPADERCPGCGATMKRPPPEASTIHQDITVSRVAIEQLLAHLPPDAPRYSKGELARLALATREERLAQYLRLQKIQQVKGLKAGWVDREYRRTFGTFPRFSAEELAGATPAAKPIVPYRPFKVSVRAS